VTASVPLSALQALGIRYLNAEPAADDERALDAYRAAGVYAAAGAPVHESEPRLPKGDGIGAGDVIRDLGALNGAIAEEVARARQGGRAVLMTGGNCCHITGIVGGLQDAHGPGVRAGLVWFDAHGDFNTPQTTLSGMLGGMPVAVCAGLAYPVWREGSHIVAPLPTDRLVMVDVRNLDEAEEQLIRAVGIPIVPVSPALPGGALHQAVTELAARVDMLYLHVDADILDERYVPDNRTREPGGPDMEQVFAAVDAVMATGKVAVYAVVSVDARGPGRDRAVASGIELIRGGLESWRRHGMAG
jgi:arginase